MSAADLGKVIRARHKELGYTQVEVAEMMECSLRLDGEIERGRGSVGFDRIVSYARTWGSIWQLLRGGRLIITADLNGQNRTMLHSAPLAKKTTPFTDRACVAPRCRSETT